MDVVRLPGGFTCGHWTDADGRTGCTVVLAPPGAIAAGERQGGGPGTRESDLLSPATSTAGPQAFVMSGGSAYGLASCEGVVAFLRDAGRGQPTPAGRVPLVSGAVVYDLLNAAPVAPDAAAGRAAADAAGPVVERGLVGAGTGCTVGKLLGPDAWTRTGIGAAALRAGDATVVAISAANAVGDVIGEDGSVLAGARRDGAFVRAVDLLATMPPPAAAERANTTITVVCTDARLTKLDAYLVSRAMGAGLARAVNPCSTAWDGDLSVCMASGEVEAEPGLVAVMAAEATTAAIRDAARQSASA